MCITLLLSKQLKKICLESRDYVSTDSTLCFDFEFDYRAFSTLDILSNSDICSNHALVERINRKPRPGHFISATRKKCTAQRIAIKRLIFEVFVSLFFSISFATVSLLVEVKAALALNIYIPQQNGE